MFLYTWTVNGNAIAAISESYDLNDVSMPCRLDPTAVTAHYGCQCAVIAVWSNLQPGHVRKMEGQEAES